MITINCTNCGDETEKKPYQVEKQENSFCGLDCYWDWQNGRDKTKERRRVTLECENCDTDFEVQQYREDTALYCSDECKNIAMTTNDDWRKSFWKETRDLVKERDDYTCQLCGERGGNLHAHHITPVYVGGKKYDPYNLTTLCKECHYETHADMGYPAPNTDEAEKLKQTAGT